MQRKYKRLKLDSGQAYVRSPDSLLFQSSKISYGITCCTSLHRVHSDLDAVTLQKYSCWNYGVTNVAPTQKDRPLPLKKRSPTPKHTCLGENKNLGYGSQWDLKPGMTVLAKTSSNLTDRPKEGEVELVAESESESQQSLPSRGGVTSSSQSPPLVREEAPFRNMWKSGITKICHGSWWIWNWKGLCCSGPAAIYWAGLEARESAVSLRSEMALLAAVNQQLVNKQKTIWVL
jgi:hypothetical protein